MRRTMSHFSPSPMIDYWSADAGNTDFRHRASSQASPSHSPFDPPQSSLLSPIPSWRRHCARIQLGRLIQITPRRNDIPYDTSIPTIDILDGSKPGCSALPYDVDASYEAGDGDQVLLDGTIYECKQSPHSLWCHDPSYPPVLFLGVLREPVKALAEEWECE